MYLPRVTPNFEAVKAQGTTNLSSWESFAGGVAEGATTGLMGAAVRFLAPYMDEPVVMIGDQLVENPYGAKPISEADWKLSHDYREGLKYDPGMTVLRASLLAAEHDRRERQAYADEKTVGLGQNAARIAGQFLGNALDPTNYIPMLGEAALVTRFGVVAGKAASGALTNAAIVASAQGLDMVTSAQLQQDPDWSAAALNVGIAAAFGGTLGALSGVMTRVPAKDHITATAKALADDAAGHPVDVAPLIQPRIEELARQRAIIADTGLPEPLRRQAALALGLDLSHLPDTGLPADLMSQAEKIFPENRKPSFAVSVPKQDVLPELSLPQAKAAEGIDIGVHPDVMNDINTRYSELSAAKGASRLTEEVKAMEPELSAIRQKSKAWIQAALCLGRELF